MLSSGFNSFFIFNFSIIKGLVYFVLCFNIFIFLISIIPDMSSDIKIIIIAYIKSRMLCIVLFIDSILPINPIIPPITV